MRQKTSYPALCGFMGWNAQGNFGPFTFYTNKHRKLVSFLTSPEKEEPSYLRILNRYKFEAAAILWNWLNPSTRALWAQLAQLARLRISGYNLFVYYHVKNDRPAIVTLEHQTGITVLDVP